MVGKYEKITLSIAAPSSSIIHIVLSCTAENIWKQLHSVIEFLDKESGLH